MKKTHMRGWVLGVVAIAVLALAVGLLARTGSRTEPTDSARTAPTSSSDAGRRPRTAMPTPPPGGGLRIRGVVLGHQGPVAGARVTAWQAEPGQTLSELPCPERVTKVWDKPSWMANRRLPGCLREAADEVLGLVGAREGEALVFAEVRSAEDGTFVLEGLPPGAFALWAEDAHGAALRPGVPAGAGGVELQLRANHEVEGTVVGDDGPLPGARVTVVHLEPTRFFDATTGPDGHFRIGPLPDEGCVLIATADGWLPRLFAQCHLSPEDPPLRLSRPRHVTGRVVNPGGAPVAGAEVRLLPAVEGPVLSLGVTASDAAGRFTFASLPPERLLLQAERDGQYALARITLDTAPTDDVVLTLGEALLVEGTVRDTERRPIAGAEVRSIGSPQRDTVTGPDGRYRLGPLEAGDHAFSVSAPLHLPQLKLAALKEPGLAPVDFELTRATPIEGRVVDTEGKPVPDVTLRLRVPTGRTGVFNEKDQSRSDADGHFVVQASEPGDYRLDVEGPSCLPTTRSVRAPAENVQVVVRRGAGVSGTVTEADGLPSPGAFVKVLSEDGSKEVIRSTPTDEAGRFTLGGLGPGRYLVEATVSDEGVDRTVSRPFTLEENQQAEVSLRFEPGWTLSGRVVDGSGQPVAGADVSAQPSPGTTPPWRSEQEGYELWKQGYVMDHAAVPRGVHSDADGRFTLRHLVADAYDLSASKEGHSCASSRVPGNDLFDACVRVNRDTSEVRVVLERLARLRGRVVGPDDAPVTSFSVNDKDFRAEDGAFSLPIDVSGPETLQLTAPDLAPTRRKVAVRAGEDLDVGTLRMERGRRVRGVVVDAETSAPVENVRVRLVGLDGWRGGRTEVTGEVTGPDGTFAFPRVETQPFIFVVENQEGYLPLNVSLPPKEEDVTLRLDPGARIAITVRDAKGRPLEARVSFDRREVHVNGSSVVRGIAAGEYTVAVYALQEPLRHRFRPQRVQVPAHGRVDLTFTEETGGATLRLHVPPGEVHNLVLLPGSVPPPTSVDALGRAGLTGILPEWEPTDIAVFRNVPEGRATLLLLSNIQPESYRYHLEELDVPAQGTVFREARPTWRLFEFPKG